MSTGRKEKFTISAYFLQGQSATIVAGYLPAKALVEKERNFLEQTITEHGTLFHRKHASTPETGRQPLTVVHPRHVEHSAAVGRCRLDVRLPSFSGGFNVDR